MGLTLSWNYHTVGRTSDKLVKDIMHNLLSYATQLKDEHVFTGVSELRHFDALDLKAIHDEIMRRRESNIPYDEFELNKDIIDPEWEWSLSLLMMAGRSVTRKYKMYKSWKGKWHYEVATHSAPPAEVWMFIIDVADGSEPATFALVKYPKTITVKNPAYPFGEGTPEEFIEIPTGITGWHWKSFCKTQFASRNGILNFMRGHVGLVTFLDFVKKFTPLETEVSDDGNFWETRNLVNLSTEIQEWDEMLKGLASGFSEANSTSPIREWNPYDNEPPEGLEKLENQTELMSGLRLLVELSAKENERMKMHKITSVQDAMFWLRLMRPTLAEQAKEEDAVGFAANRILFILFNDWNGKRYEDVDITSFVKAVDEYRKIT